MDLAGSTALPANVIRLPERMAGAAAGGALAHGNCHCGAALTVCPGCRSGRCLTCDPYSSDDCRYRDR